MRQVNRLVWGVSGVATALALAVPGARILTRAHVTENTPGLSATPVATLPAASDGLVVDSCGANVRITAQSVKQIQASEAGSYSPDQGITPSVTWSLSGQQVTIGDPGCGSQFSPSQFTVTVPDGTPVNVESQSGNVNITGTGLTTVDSQGGNVSIEGTHAATVNSGSGFVSATNVDGALTVDSQGGNVQVARLTGELNTDTGSGDLNAMGLDTATMNAVTEGGNVRVVFASAPRNVVLSTGSGDATVDLPGGPYALNATTGSGSWNVRIPTDPQATRIITVTTEGGNLLIAP